MTNAVAGLGLAPDAAMVTFPIEMFLPGSDISPVEARKREFYDGLTRWRSAFDCGLQKPSFTLHPAPGQTKILPTFEFPALLVMAVGSFEPTFHLSESRCCVVCMPLCEEA